jgi:transcriptional regulator with XRE-family HTH domain
MTIQEKIGKRIFELRKGKIKLSQEKFAYEADIERSFFTHIEKGNKNISIGTLQKVLTAFGISFKEFFNDEIFNDSAKKKKKN